MRSVHRTAGPRAAGRRRGVTSVLAMLYLILFSSLAVGFYAVATMSGQVARNERDVAAAQWAAESGMAFIRHHLWEISIPHTTVKENLLLEAYADLRLQLDGSPNMDGGTVGFSNPDTLCIPVEAGKTIKIETGGPGFRAQITREGRQFRVKIIAASGGALRAVQLDYDIAEKASRIFDYGLASKGAIRTEGSSWVTGQTDATKGSVFSALIGGATPSVEIQGEGISGDITYMEGALAPTFKKKVGNISDPATIWAKHIHEIEESPEFPIVDTSEFEQYVDRDYVGTRADRIYENMRIPANYAGGVTFNGGDTVRGVLFIERPNKVTFNGNVKIEGCIVVDTGDTATAGSLTTNVITFSGNGGTKTGVESLPTNQTQFDGLRDLKGSFILAPGFDVNLTGNFGAVNGSIVGDKISVDGSSTLVVKGTLIGLAEETMLVKGNGEVVVASTGTSNYPSGLRFGSHYFPLPGTYKEVTP